MVSLLQFVRMILSGTLALCTIFRHIFQSICQTVASSVCRGSFYIKVHLPKYYLITAPVPDKKNSTKGTIHWFLNRRVYHTLVCFNALQLYNLECIKILKCALFFSLLAGINFEKTDNQDFSSRWSCLSVFLSRLYNWLSLHLRPMGFCAFFGNTKWIDKKWCRKFCGHLLGNCANWSVLLSKLIDQLIDWLIGQLID